MKSRLINCDFLNDMTTTNEATLLYYRLIVNADNRGFVGNAIELCDTLENKQQESVELVRYTFKDALFELQEKGLIYIFENNHKGVVVLIRHWYYHNHYVKTAWTNYGKILKQVKLVDSEYILRDKNEIKPDKKQDEDELQVSYNWDLMIKEAEDGNKKDDEDLDELPW